MSKYKLVAVDIDGTLLNDEQKVSDNTLYELKRISNTVPIILATGRGYKRIEAISDVLEINYPLVLANGADIWKSNSEILHRSYLLEKDVRKLYKIAKEYGTAFWGYIPYELVNQNNFDIRFINDTWIKFGFSHSKISVLERIMDEINDMEHIEYTSSNQFNIEVSPKGITKKFGLEKVCELLDIHMQEVIAFGDNLNDLEMIKSVGLGVAMGNATEELKENADMITDSNNEDGIGKVIRKYF